jgi:hypothetical protein
VQGWGSCIEIRLDEFALSSTPDTCLKWISKFKCLAPEFSVSGATSKADVESASTEQERGGGGGVLPQPLKRTAFRSRQHDSPDPSTLG